MIIIRGFLSSKTTYPLQNSCLIYGLKLQASFYWLSFSWLKLSPLINIKTKGGPKRIFLAMLQENLNRYKIAFLLSIGNGLAKVLRSVLNHYSSLWLHWAYDEQCTSTFFIYNSFLLLDCTPICSWIGRWKNDKIDNFYRIQRNFTFVKKNYAFYCD